MYGCHIDSGMEWTGALIEVQSRLPKASNVSEHIELSERSQKVGC